MYLLKPLRIVLLLGLCALPGGGAAHALPEKIPRDKVIHPIFTPVSPPELLPDGRKDPAYPEKWRKLRLGARVILQGEVTKEGVVARIDVLKTDLKVEADCAPASGDSTEQSPNGAPAGGSGSQVAPPEAAKGFEAAAVTAVKQWKFRPGMQNGLPVAVYQTFIVEFTSCSQGTKKPDGPPSPLH